MKRMRPVISLMVFCLLLPGCHREQDRLQAAIRQYCLFLAEGYQKQDLSKLNFVATDEQSQRVYRHMAALGEGRIKMDSKLLAIEWVSVDQDSPGDAKVTTREGWAYAYVNMDTGKIMNSNAVDYLLQYHLQKSNEQWLVATVDVLESGTGKDHEGASFMQRPADKPIANRAGGK